MLRDGVSRVRVLGVVPGLHRGQVRCTGCRNRKSSSAWRVTASPLGSSWRQSCCLYGAKRERDNASELDTRLHRDKGFFEHVRAAVF